MTQLATTWQPPGGAFWHGAWQAGHAQLLVRNPENGELVGRVADCSPTDVDDAVRSVADAVLRGIEWPIWRRREALHEAARIVLERQELFVDLISKEGCKPVRDAAKEVLRTTETVRLSAEQAGRLQGQTLPFGDSPRGENRVGWYTREPVGVVAAITPFNDPLNLVAHKLAPALIGGNGVVLKPAEQTPLTAMAFAQALLDAGVPADRLAVLPGSGAGVGTALVSHPLVDMVSFTGGYRTGNEVARAAGAKKTLMELGGNGAVLVLTDADLPRAAAAIVDVLTTVPAGSRVLTDEVFGPVVSIEPFDTVDEAVAEVNRSDYGLQAGVFTRDIDAALHVVQRLRVGAVMINDTGDFRIDAMPFGGAKRSGVGREGVPYAVDAMTEPKIVAIHRTA